MQLLGVGNSDMSVIPWDAKARFVHASGRPTEVGTLRGCVRAWSRLTKLGRSEIRLLCDDAIFLDGWKIAFTNIERVKIDELSALP